MVSPYVLAGSSYGVAPFAEVEKPAALPEVFHIDDLLDFSCEDIGGPIVGGEVQLSGVTVENSHSSANGGETSISTSSTMEVVKSEPVELPSVPVEITEAKTDLCVPCDDLADLEWLSSFVEDSFTMVDPPDIFSQYGGFASGGSNSARTPSTKLSDSYQKSSPVSVLETSATSSELTGQDYRDVSVPGRARSKRSRTGARIWTSPILPTSSSVNSFESMGADSYAMSYSPIESEDASGESTVDAVEQEDEDSQCSKRYKLTNSSQNQNLTTNNVNSTNSNSKGRKKNHQDNAQPWRCMHCQTQRTPQWRTGPMGPKTLCNACGVRFKSGRLLPEYRPAGSPTYVASKHSHSHKKVLEMRRERELRVQHQPQGHHHVHQLSQLHGATPLREKTNTQKEQQGVKSSSMLADRVKSDYQSYGSKSQLEMQKCSFSKLVELPRPRKLELPRYETNTSGLEFSKCLTSTTAILGPRLDFGLDDNTMRDIRGL